MYRLWKAKDYDLQEKLRIRNSPLSGSFIHGGWQSQPPRKLGKQRVGRRGRMTFLRPPVSTRKQRLGKTRLTYPILVRG